MDKFVIKRKRTSEEFLSSSITSDGTDPQQVPSISSTQVPSSSSAHGPKVPYVDVPSPQATSTVVDEEVSRWDLQTDTAMRKPILSYHPNDQDKVRRAYMQRGPCQPKNFPFPQKLMGQKKPSNRRFNEAWFLKHGSWLEYSISKDAAFCLPCYLFRSCGKGKGVCDAFVNAGFSNWSQPDKLEKHVGNQNSVHNDAYMKSRELLQESHHLRNIVRRQTTEEGLGYMIRVNASIDCMRFLLCQGLASRGHDESDTSHNQDIQKEIVSAAAMETMDVIRADIGDSLFAVMVDESRGVSIREQMAVCIRYVNKEGCIIKRFIGIIHVLETTAISLKNSVDALLSKYGLNIMRLRGQCYDGASNMQGEYNVLKALILKENPSAYVVHCFSHQLQLALMNVAQKHGDVALFFTIVSEVVTIVYASCKRRDVLRQKELARVVELVEKGERLTGSGLNQETCLKRPSDTRWGTHYNTLLSLILMFPSILEMLEIVSREGTSEARGKAYAFLILMPTFDFVFTLLGITNELSQALQRKDQDIVNAMNLVKISKEQLQTMRDDGWNSLMNDISAFCAKNNITVPKMMSPYVPLGRGRRNLQEETNLHHFQVGLFNKGALIRLPKLYPSDFSKMDLMILERQLDTFLRDVLSSNEFFELVGISGLAKKMVETKRDIVYPLVYLLITLSLILPVATATVERVFSAMQIVKNRLRSRIGDEYMNNCLLTYIEREIFRSISTDKIRKRFQLMAPRRGYC
ncbi:zinc finger MYM-type protein 1-like isoform X2 [Papaver somniferum]|uniref:zinc finger MYM-type protein 1-like isoform X2 n=1 Tax=Papaver somniferum TaxID=3469 RepID=UPI000E6FCF24|nr:zinc finger MYM-type protein 1-like isoform X2 [Papaver somniferum]